MHGVKERCHTGAAGGEILVQTLLQQKLDHTVGAVLSRAVEQGLRAEPDFDSAVGHLAQSLLESTELVAAGQLKQLEILRGRRSGVGKVRGNSFAKFRLGLLFEQTSH